MLDMAGNQGQAPYSGQSPEFAGGIAVGGVYLDQYFPKPMATASVEYLVTSDGYGIVLTSLEHYIRRLRMLGSDPANNAGMFGAAIRQAAITRYPVARRARQTVLDFLAGGSAPTQDDMQTIKNALECYESDMRDAAGSERDAELGADPASTMKAIREAKAGLCLDD